MGGREAFVMMTLMGMTVIRFRYPTRGDGFYSNGERFPIIFKEDI